MNWHQALDIQMDTHRWVSKDEGIMWLANFAQNVYEGEGTVDMIAGIIRHLKETLWRSDTIYVTSDMLHLILQAAHDLPEEAEFDPHHLLCPYGFVLFEEPIAGEDRNGLTMTVHGFAWEHGPVAYWENGQRQDVAESIMLYMFTDPTDFNDTLNPEVLEQLRSLGYPIPPLCLIHYYPMAVNASLPSGDEQGAAIVVEVCRIFMALQYLAQQTIGEPIRMRPDRASRKRFQRAYPDEPERLITLITLRRKTVKKDDHEPGQVEWSRRWVVRGHWRKQYYPSTKSHGWRYIHEYIKGPEDKPLVITERRVFNFRR